MTTISIIAIFVFITLEILSLIYVRDLARHLNERLDDQYHFMLKMAYVVDSNKAKVDSKIKPKSKNKRGRPRKIVKFDELAPKPKGIRGRPKGSKNKVKQ